MTREPSRTSLRPWLVLLVVSVSLIGAVEIALLGIGTSFFGAGYNVPRIDGWTFAIAYLPGSILLDLWLVLLIWTISVPVLARVSGSRVQLIYAAALCAVAMPIAITGLRYNVYAVLGEMFSVALLAKFSSVGSPAMVAQLMSESPELVFATAGLGLAGVVYWIGVRRLERRFDSLASLVAPRVRHLALGVVVTGGAGAAMLALTSSHHPALTFGFERKLSGAALARLIELATDVDGDGFGALAHPGDPAPFDPAIHPYAVDVPGNGRDENGVGGDHPVGFSLPPALPVPATSTRRPHVLLVYLESFRTDLLDARVNGREVTPFLDRLAREGASSSHMYAHAPWTLDSRVHLFTGSLVPRVGEPTLVDDFKSRGYTVAWFSGQDDSYGDSAHRLGAERADRFYDARQDLARRTSRSVEPVSLQVSWKTLTGRVLDYLALVKLDEPVFMYLNIVDTHYPYAHAEIDDLLGVANVTRDGIRVDRAREVRDTYANTAANVDRAIQVVFEAFRSRIGNADLVVIVTADHGQAFYEYGTLGHGQTLDPLETHVPLIVWGMAGEWPEPIAPTDLRALLLRNLDTADASHPQHAHFVPDPERLVLQFVPSITEPRYIALRGLESAVVYDFARDRLERTGSDRDHPVLLEPELGNELFWRWETVQSQALDAEHAESPR